MSEGEAGALVAMHHVLLGREWNGSLNLMLVTASENKVLYAVVNFLVAMKEVKHRELTRDVPK